jgi:arylsulfatase A-like enzyme
VVVLMTIDAVRADDVFDPANAELFPTLTQMALRGVVFRHAMASGTQTPLSVAGLFSGRTFSEQLWTEHGDGTVRYLYPAEDSSPRFPELLRAHGVVTFTIAGLIFLQNDFGVVRGFSEEKVVVKNARHAPAPELVDPLLNRLRQGGAEPMFLYTHLTEPHEPYDRGRKEGTPHERYLSEISVADKQVGRVLKLLQQHYGDRWALFVTSDHGEAFGEHHTHEHAKSLYEELLHVPLFAMSPAFPHRVVDERVSLVDLGPTILDLFGVETPATFLGQSLAPLLAGGSMELTRPLFAEGRLRRAMVFPDGLKVIEDLRRKTAEVYDLETDPKELRNLFDKDPARSDVALATLRAFFAAHTRTEGGYVPPWKP